MDWLPTPMTESVRLQLDLAAEQLHQVKVMIEADELSLSAQRVLVRTALISASIATWILSPDDAVERRARHRLLIEQTTFRHHQALTEQAGLEKKAGHPVQQNLQIMADHTAQRLSQIKALRMTDQQMEHWNDTKIIRKAALFCVSPSSRPGCSRQGSSVGVSHHLRRSAWAGVGSLQRERDACNHPRRHARPRHDDGSDVQRPREWLHGRLLDLDLCLEAIADAGSIARAAQSPRQGLVLPAAPTATTF